jgi:hypothetical protein
MVEMVKSWAQLMTSKEEIRAVSAVPLINGRRPLPLPLLQIKLIFKFHIGPVFINSVLKSVY